jgi:hypothetical protein
LTNLNDAIARSLATYASNRADSAYTGLAGYIPWGSATDATARAWASWASNTAAYASNSVGNGALIGYITGTSVTNNLNALSNNVLAISTNGANLQLGSVDSNAFNAATKALLGAGGGSGFPYTTGNASNNPGTNFSFVEIPTGTLHTAGFQLGTNSLVSDRILLRPGWGSSVAAQYYFEAGLSYRMTNSGATANVQRLNVVYAQNPPNIWDTNTCAGTFPCTGIWYVGYSTIPRGGLGDAQPVTDIAEVYFTYGDVICSNSYAAVGGVIGPINDSQLLNVDDTNKTLKLWVVLTGVNKQVQKAFARGWLVK